MARTVLITGISGFIARHCAIEFLKQGYRVRGTLRSLARAEDLRPSLSRNADTAGLEFVEAELLSDTGWDEAMAGCDVVVHLASPFPLSSSGDGEEVIRPAVDGALRVLGAAVRNGVPRFVHTSSMIAVYSGHPASRTAPFTEDDWADLNGPGITGYARSKTLSEKAARDFVARADGAIHYSSVNPGLVFGPLLDREFGTSVDIIRAIARGRYPALPRTCIFAVDVRDVARMHVLAAETGQPGGGRYLACEMMWMREVALAIKEALGAKGRRVSTIVMPDWATRLVAMFDAGAATAANDLGRQYEADCSRTKSALGIEFIPGREAIMATTRSLVQFGMI